MNDYTWLMAGLMVLVVLFYLYVFIFRDWLQYRQARKEIFAYVKSYKQKCTGNNRYVVTVDTLQETFREYSTTIILNVWLDLVKEHMIVTDPQDQEWCIR